MFCLLLTARTGLKIRYEPIFIMENMRAIYLKDMQEVKSGKKSAIVTTKEVADLVGRKALVAKDDRGEYVIGMATITAPIPLPTEHFKQYQAKHQISEGDKLHWWGDTKQFYLYEIKNFTPCEQEEVEIPPGTKMLLDIKQERLYSPLMILEKIDNLCLIGQREL